MCEGVLSVVTRVIKINLLLWNNIYKYTVHHQQKRLWKLLK